MWNFLIMLLLTLVATGCGPRYVDYFPCRDDGSLKPAVAILPLRDATKAGNSATASDQVFQVILSDAMNNGELYFLSPEELQNDGGQIGPIDFFTDETALANRFSSADFVVIMELIEEQYTPCGACQPPIETVTVCFPAEVLLTLKVRLKVIDVRPRCPRVILQEIFTQGYFMPSHGEFSSHISQKAFKRFGTRLEKRLEQVIGGSY